MTGLALASAALAGIPLALCLWNLTLYRRLPHAVPAPGTGVSILIPARNEESRIATAVRAALASEGAEVAVVVLDDHSSDRTAEIVREIAAGDGRVRLETAPPLPPGWSGKQHACHVLARLAPYPLLAFIDADVRLSRDAAARIAAFMERRRDIGLASGFPAQITGSLAERLVIPQIFFLLLGYLPVWGMRRSVAAGFGAGCGQLIVARRDAYEFAGGHAAIRESMHDGIKLPRAFRRAGVMTDLFDASDVATCRMYAGARELWEGFSKNATEGMATPVALPVWTVLLGVGQVLPYVLLPAALLGGAPAEAVAFAAFALAAVLALRLVLALRFDQPILSALMHPVGVVAVLAIQWSALLRGLAGRPATWRGRSYPAPR